MKIQEIYHHISCINDGRLIYIWMLSLVFLSEFIYGSVVHKEGPLIIPNINDVTVKPGYNYTFLCESSEPIAWDIPSDIKYAYAEVHGTHSSEFTPVINYTIDVDGKFKSFLKLQNIDYTFVGYYYCVKNSSNAEKPSSLLETKQSSRIYLFVEDLLHPIVLSDQLILTNNSNPIVPCKPTSRSSTVDLININRLEEEHEEYIQRNIFDGFRVVFRSKLRDIYICKADNAQRTFDVIFDSFNKNPAKISSKTDNYGIEGSSLELNCSFEISSLHNIHIDWILPKNNTAEKGSRIKMIAPVVDEEYRLSLQRLNPNQLREENYFSRYKMISHLTVFNLSKDRDVGDYHCHIKYRSIEIGRPTLNVAHVWKPNEPYINMKIAGDPMLTSISSIRYTCAGLKDHYVEWSAEYFGNPQPAIVWTDNLGKMIEWSQTKGEMDKIYAVNANRLTKLRIHNLSISDSGTYTLHADNGKTKEEKEIELVVYDKPQLTMSTVFVEPGEEATMRCKIVGYPPSSVVCSFIECSELMACDFNNELLLNVSSIQHTKINQTAIMSFMPTSTGVVKCTAENAFGFMEMEDHIVVIDDPWRKKRSFKTLLVSVFSLTIPVVVFFAYFYWRAHRDKLLRKALLANFEKGSPDKIDSKFALSEQAEHLPYDKKYEFPRKKLQLLGELGSGAFGIVVKASAQNILPNEEETTVAIKMLCQNADNETLKALISELKILAHLGNHLNVINLLGAVTKNIVKHELMIIVEYCRFGNLQSFLRKNRKCFVDQIDREQDVIDPTIQTKKNFHAPTASYSPLSALNGDKEARKAFTTTDLLSWSFQVARGMSYLASRNVLHSDLAARNVLLCDDNVVKICDFGLARSLYKRNIYQKKGEERMPINWMAIESISNQTFSTYSDVWSFGVFLWELFSLGDEPYADIGNDSLLSKLKDGQRMEQPDHATETIYRIMRWCWLKVPHTRPSFSILEKIFEKMLPLPTVEHFIKLK